MFIGDYLNLYDNYNNNKYIVQILNITKQYIICKKLKMYEHLIYYNKTKEDDIQNITSLINALYFQKTDFF